MYQNKFIVLYDNKFIMNQSKKCDQKGSCWIAVHGKGKDFCPRRVSLRYYHKEVWYCEREMQDILKNKDGNYVQRREV